ncbi:MAG TPA: segregation/condensation protein A [Oscillospiraceae bacterium]|nr:segregation/condensation protein A [Oscillospiraceae bacterium]
METPIYRLQHVVRARSEEMEDFVGPLDLILFLLGKNKIEIQDIQVSLILDQYLEYLRQREELDLEIASDFVAMAAHLVYIKTRMLLSLHDEEAASEMELLIRSLEERRRSEDYERIRAVAVPMNEAFLAGRDYLAKGPEIFEYDRSYRYVHKPEDLLKSMESLLERAEGRLPPPVRAFEGVVGREPYSVADKASEILERLLSAGATRFGALFRGSRSRSEIVATFVAVLELCRAHAIRLSGSGEECTVTRVSGHGGDGLLSEDYDS